MKSIFSVLTMTALVLSASVANAAPDEKFVPASETFLRADGGDDSAIKPAVEQFTTLSKAEPTDPLLLVHLGAATAMQARIVMMPWKKISAAEDGMALEDKALAMLGPEHDTKLQHGVPVSVWVRFVAASTFLAVPESFHRRQPGRKLLNDVLTSPLLENASLEFRGRVWMRAARFAVIDKRPDDAKQFYQQVIAAGAPQAAIAKTELEKLGV